MNEGPGIIGRMWRGGLVSQAGVDRIHAGQAVDRVGDHAHLITACVFCVLVAAPMSIVEFAGIPVWITLFIRASVRWRQGLWKLCLCVFVQPLFWVLLLWTAWQFVALIWSGNRDLGLEEIGSLRWAWTLLVLYPVLDRRRSLIVALAVGYLVANGVQGLHLIGTIVGWDAVTFGRMPDRISGWWQPVVGGTMLVGALGLHLPAALMGRGRTQVLAIAGSAVTFLCVIATGSRGPWLAALALIAIVGACAVWSIRPGKRLRVLLIGAVVTVIVGSAAWFTVGGSVARRADLARQEVVGAIQEKRFTSDTGARLLMWWWTLEAAAERPIVGVGTGGYSAWVAGHLVDQGIDPGDRRIHDHAHSTILHVLATTGIVGVCLGGLVIVITLRGALTGVTRLGSYEAGPFFAVIGLLLAGMFDPIHVNAQTSALLFTLMALCQFARPSGRSS